MKELATIYISELDDIKKQIQESEELALFLDEEEEEQYKALVEKYEGGIHKVYEKVAKDEPLQLISLEEYLLDSAFEGLYIPKLLGYTVLRGQLNENFKYRRPQTHFRKILDKIILSSNFDQISLRVGQAIQIGFALSSDIWITNIINSINNKRVKSFLESQNLSKYHDIRLRKTGYVRYSKQFQSLNFYTANFPTTLPEFIREFELLKSFLLYRAKNHPTSHNSFVQEIYTFISNHSDNGNNPNIIEMYLLLGLKFDLHETVNENFKGIINKWRTTVNLFEETFFRLIKEKWSEFDVSAKDEKRLIPLIDTTPNDTISAYFKVLNSMQSLGYVNEQAIDQVREFYYSNEGLSLQNTCLRNTVLKYFQDLMNKLEVTDYGDYFEINKTISHYIQIFDNQHFNQDVKDTSLKYIKKLLKHYTDKRGKDYQDIKRFVQATFLDFNFMNEKQLKEFFKTKRKAKPAS